MAVQRFLIPLLAFSCLICFTQCVNNFHDHFKFEKKSSKDVKAIMGRKIINVPKKNISLDECMEVCGSNSSCWTAIFTEVDYYALKCHPENCSHSFAHTSHGECHLANKTKEGTKINYESKLKGPKNYYVLHYPPTCRPKTFIRSGESRRQLAGTPTRDPNKPGCYIYKYICVPEAAAGVDYIAVGNGTSTCCEDDQHPWILPTLKCLTQEELDKAGNPPGDQADMPPGDQAGMAGTK